MVYLWFLGEVCLPDFFDGYICEEPFNQITVMGQIRRPSRRQDVDLSWISGTDDTGGSLPLGYLPHLDPRAIYYRASSLCHLGGD